MNEKKKDGIQGIVKLSPYTIASNCTDITDCNYGIREIFEAVDYYKERLGRKEPKYFWSRLEKLQAKRDKFSVDKHGMKYDEWLRTIELNGTTATNKKANIAAGLYDEILISFKKKDIRRSQNLVPNEHGHLICAFDIRQQSASAPTYWSNHLSGANIDELSELKKKFDKKIKQWQKSDTIDVQDFMLFVALELRLRASKKNDKHFSYYLALYDTGDRYVLRISDHHYDARTEEYNKSKFTTSVTFSTINTEDWDYFKPDEKTHAVEYVYYEDKVGKDELIAIAKDIVSFVETGKYTPSIEPDEVHHSPEPKDGMQGADEKPKFKVGDAVLNVLNNKEYEIVDVILNKWGDNIFAYTYRLSDKTITTGENLKLINKSDGYSLFNFSQHLSAQLDNGESYDWAKVQKLAKELGVKSTPQELMQACEVAIVMSARRMISQHSDWSAGQCFEQMKRLYSQQPIISTNSSDSLRWQQYSTPCPISYLAGLYVSQGNPQYGIYEPTAGNGMLTIALPVGSTVVNEIDPVRFENLKKAGYAQAFNGDAVALANSEHAQRNYNVIMNPPFGNLKQSEYLYRDGKVADNSATYTFKRLDHKIAVLSLEKFLGDNGARAAIIVGGKLAAKYNKADDEAYWNKQGRLQGAFGDFISYLNRAYLVDDIFYIDGKLYAKQGTQFPIVLILVRGRRKQWDSDPLCKWRTYDSIKDKPVQSFDELMIRMRPYLASNEHDALIERLNAKLVRLEKMKIEIVSEPNFKFNIGDSVAFCNEDEVYDFLKKCKLKNAFTVVSRDVFDDGSNYYSVKGDLSYYPVAESRLIKNQ